jgi:hypothetical protein
MSSIQTFTSNLIAIYRPKKHTHSLLEYNEDTHKWRRFLLDPDITPTIRRYRQIIRSAPVKIKIDATNEFVQCVGDGTYLKYGQKIVPVIRKLTSSIKKFPMGFYAGEIRVEGDVQHDDQVTPPLWTLYTTPTTAPQVAPTPPTTAPPSIYRKNPMPQRIAWLIAEDAAKKDMDCPITLNPISPITASVTSCFHVFDTDAIEHALRLNAMCPMCRTKNATYTKCFNE